jgi:hypothetical protein
VNSAYVRGPDGISWPEFFARVDVTDAVAPRLAELSARLTAMRQCLSMVELPDAEPGKQCSTPYDREFWDRCTADKPADWIAHLPRLSPTRASELRALGIDAISSIPPEFPLTAKQVIIRDAIVTGRPYVAKDLLEFKDFIARVPETEPLNERLKKTGWQKGWPPLPYSARPHETYPLHQLASAWLADGVENRKDELRKGYSNQRSKRSSSRKS